MSTYKRIIVAIFAALPAIGFGILEYISRDASYFWPQYEITLAVFLAASLLAGFFLPVLLGKLRISNPWINIILPALLAYLIAGLTNALISATPLCVGQNNGDGNNDLTRCLAVAVIVFLVYSPLELVMLAFSAIFGAAVLSRTPTRP